MILKMKPISVSFLFMFIVWEMIAWFLCGIPLMLSCNFAYWEFLVIIYLWIIKRMYGPELSFTFINLLLFNIVIRSGSLQSWDVCKILSLELLKLNADLFFSLLLSSFYDSSSPVTWPLVINTLPSFIFSLSYCKKRNSQTLAIDGSSLFTNKFSSR